MHFPVFPPSFMAFLLCPPGGGKGPVMGALPPFEAPFHPPRIPPLPRAEPLCSLPACSDQSFGFGTGGRIHPSPHAGRHEVRTRGLPFGDPGPLPEVLSGCGHDLRNPEPPAGPQLAPCCPWPRHSPQGKSELDKTAKPMKSFSTPLASGKDHPRDPVRRLRSRSAG